MIESKYKEMDSIELPMFIGEIKMLPFCTETYKGLDNDLKILARSMLSKIKNLRGIAYITLHGEKLSAGETLRRPGPHIDGNYEPYNMTFGGGGWKVGEGGPEVGSSLHTRQYVKETGGIVLASNHESCRVWKGKFDTVPGVGGDCSHIDLGESNLMKRNTVYYGNNHCIHESLPVLEDVFRVMARITLPETHCYDELGN